MGFRFRKSIKIAPGIKLNFGKKSTGLSIGGKAAGITINSKTGARVRTSIPGTGISYSSKIGGKAKSDKDPKHSAQEPWEKNKYVMEADNDLRIIKDSAQLVEETLNPDTFFSRYDLLIEKSEHLASIEKYIPVSGGSTSDAFLEVKNSYQVKVTEFIYRYFSDAFTKAQALKTLSGKKNKIKKCYESLLPYADKMSQENMDFAKTMYDRYTKELGL